MNPRKLTLIAIVPALLALAAAGCGGTSESGGSGGKVALVAYSTPQEAYEAIIPAFQETPDGEGVGFKQSYGASGDQAARSSAGLPADVVALLAGARHRQARRGGTRRRGLEQRPVRRASSPNSVVVFAVRKGNPKNIKTWDDLIKPGVEVITPNPFTSGGAKWNIMAAYGAQIEQGKTERRPQEYLKKLFDNVVVQDKSAREALQTFVGGKGDVLLAYENEAITAQQKGEDVDYVVPDQTILIQNPIAVTTDSKNPNAAKAFVDFVPLREAQKIFVDNGYRPVIDGPRTTETSSPTPPGLFDDRRSRRLAGGQRQVLRPRQGIVAKIEEDLGVSTDQVTHRAPAPARAGSRRSAGPLGPAARPRASPRST